MRATVPSFQFPVSSFQFPVSSFQFPVSSFQRQRRNLGLESGHWEPETKKGRTIGWCGLEVSPIRRSHVPLGDIVMALQLHNHCFTP
jgi:hypothetical protein